jgi:hypothetical protein
MLAAAVSISAAGGTADAKMAMQTFPVPASAGPHMFIRHRTAFGFVRLYARRARA